MTSPFGGVPPPWSGQSQRPAPKSAPPVKAAPKALISQKFTEQQTAQAIAVGQKWNVKVADAAAETAAIAEAARLAVVAALAAHPTDPDKVIEDSAPMDIDTKTGETDKAAGASSSSDAADAASAAAAAAAIATTKAAVVAAGAVLKELQAVAASTAAKAAAAATAASEALPVPNALPVRLGPIMSDPTENKTVWVQKGHSRFLRVEQSRNEEYRQEAATEGRLVRPTVAADPGYIIGRITPQDDAHEKAPEGVLPSKMQAAPIETNDSFFSSMRRKEEPQRAKRTMQNPVAKARCRLFKGSPQRRQSQGLSLCHWYRHPLRQLSTTRMCWCRRLMLTATSSQPKCRPRARSDGDQCRLHPA